MIDSWHSVAAQPVGKLSGVAALGMLAITSFIIHYFSMAT